MSEEQTPNTQQDQGQEPAGEATPDSGGRDWERLFRESTAREKKLNERLSAIEQSQADAKEAEELKQLEAKGEYETLVAKKDARIKELEDAHAAELLRRDLMTSLMKEGARNDVFIKGAIASFSGTPDEIDKYVSDLKESETNSVFFSDSTKPTGQKAPLHGSPGSRSKNTDWAQTKADLNGQDASKAVEADQRVRAYFSEHGTMPPGF